MTEELYLILHKVRGEPAFDIAEMVEIGDEVGWIIPTSGHRAYPAASWLLSTIEQRLDNGFFPINTEVIKDPKWTDWPDHYDSKRDDGAHLVNAARDILMRKGLIRASKPAQQVYRRA